MSPALKVALYATVASTVFMIEPPAIAQKADKPGATGDQLQEIVVTARRREERLQTVPITVEAFTPKALEERHIENTTDLSHFSPGLTQQSDQGRDEQYLAIRGQVNAPGGPGVVGYFDEVPDLSEPAPSGSGAGGGATGPGRYFDLEDVQVLEGPQGTLFGRNTTGGAVLLTSKKPTDDYHGFGLCRVRQLRRCRPAGGDESIARSRKAVHPRRRRARQARRLHPRTLRQ